MLTIKSRVAGGCARSRLVLLVAASLVLSLASGCVFSKQVTNAHVLELDSSRIVVGETTALDVLNSWGPPAPTDPLGLLQPASPGHFVPGSRVYRYVSKEKRCASFLALAPIDGAPVPVMPILPFLWCDDQPAYVLVLEFDEGGVVKRVSKGTTQTVWRPWSSGSDREVRIETTAMRGVSLP